MSFQAELLRGEMLADRPVHTIAIEHCESRLIEGSSYFDELFR